MINFTQEELQLLTKDQLKRLCKYYDIEVFRSWTKAKLIEVILEYLKPVEDFAEDIPMSARIKRIYQSSHKEA